MLRSLIIAFMTLPLYAAEFCILYSHEEISPLITAARELEKREPSCKWSFKLLPKRAHNAEDELLLSQALAQGVRQAPCIILSDDSGSYRILAGKEIFADNFEGNIQKARKKAKPPAEQRKKRSASSARMAELYLLYSQAAHPELSDGELRRLIAASRSLRDAKASSTQEKQLIGLRLLYPLLMKQYSRGYKGAHSSASEARLLEAIAVLEAARDLNRSSTLGKQARAERARLGAARRLARSRE